VVVMASYFATFSNLKNATLIDITLLIVLGIIYIAIGIYGFAYCAQSKSLGLQLLYFAVQIPLGGIIVYLTKGAGFNAMILLPLAGHSAVLLSQNWMYLTNVVTMVVYVGSVFEFSHDWSAVWVGLPTFLAGQIFIIVFTQMVINEEKARSEVERLVGELEVANQRLREYAIQVEELTIAKERNRLAREIHDGLGHYLTTIHMQIRAGRAVMQTDSNKSLELFSRAQNLTQEALEDVRRSVAELRASLEDKLPLTDSIKKMIKNYQMVGLDTELLVIGTPHPLSPELQLTLYRAAQEGVNNACKHAQASKIWVTLDYSDNAKVKLMIRDNGIGAEQIEEGFGLIGIKERIHLLNGDLKISSTAGQGFIIDIVVPA
jgi:signal transduction histidine kinase